MPAHPPLDSLEGAGLEVRATIGAQQANAGARFQIMVEVRNRSNTDLHWSADIPLHLSYRWLDGEGTTLPIEGMRSALPHPFAANSRAELPLDVLAPEKLGSYRLRPSLVLENRHWGCDIETGVGDDVAVEVVLPPVWPEALERSVGGKALRGAIAAANLSRTLETRPIDPAAGQLSSQGRLEEGMASGADGLRAAIDHLSERLDEVSERIGRAAGEAGMARTQGADATVQQEMVITLRQLAEWVAVTANGIFVDRIATIDAKLNHLLYRQMIPLPAAGLMLARSRYGLLALQQDDVAAVAYYSSGELPEPTSIALVERLLKPGDCFLDIGANVGAFTLVAARTVGPAGKIIAVEPVPATAAALRTTLAINGIASFTELHECALAANAGSGTMHLGSTSGHASMLEVPSYTGSATVEVPLRTGEQVIGEHRPTLIKIDVEGWEHEVLAGLDPYLRRERDVAILVEFSPVHVRLAGLTPEEWMGRIRAMRFEIWVIDEVEGTISPRDPATIGDRGTNLLLSRALPSALEPMLHAG